MTQKDRTMNGGALPPLEVASHATTDREDEMLELDKYSKDYVEAWASKCTKTSFQSELKVNESMDVDSHGLKFVAAFQSCAEEASAHGKLLPQEYVGYLVLMMRNDVVHHYSHVSRSAYQCLRKYMDSYPYATIVKDGVDHGQVVICPEAAWLPLFSERKSFFPKYFMYEDMSQSGLKYAQEMMGQHSKGKRNGSDQKWGHGDELLMHCIKAALESDEKDFNGDLLMFDYFLRVMLQDLECRIQVVQHIVSDEKQRTIYFSKIKALLENSTLWRMVVGISWNGRQMQQLVGGLVQLIVNNNGTEDMEMAEDEPEDDSPAGACTFSKAELSEIASKFLNGLLRLFGTMEGLGGFLATSSYRAASVNFRVALDEYMLEAFWTERGYCKDPRKANKLLYSLDPRDALRFVGFLTATKFTRAYQRDVIQKIGLGAWDKVKGLYDAVDVLSLSSKDLETFYQVDLEPILESYMLDMSRTMKIYRSADHIALLVSCLATNIAKLQFSGKALPLEHNELERVKQLIKMCIDRIYEQESSTNASHRLGSFGTICLSLASNYIELCV